MSALEAPVKSQTREKRENQQEKLLRAACELAASSGIAALRTRDIAKQAGVSVGTLHYCFATKEDLMQALYKYILDEFHQAFHSFAGEDKDTLETLDGQARLRLHLLRSQDTVYLAWRAFNREAWTDPVVGQIVRTHLAEQRRRFQRILENGRESGILPPSPVISDSVTAALIVSAYEGLNVQWTIDQDSVDPDEYVRSVYRLIGFNGNIGDGGNEPAR